MSNFQLSKQADPNKIFLIKFSELEGGRFDPVMALYQREIKNFNFQTQNLSDLLQSNPQYGANESGIDRKSKTEPRYIRITDINKYGLLRNNLGKTAKILENQYLLSSDDILIARSGATVGKAYIHRVKNEKCFYAGYLIRFIVDKNKVSPNYIFYYMQLKVYEKWVNAIQRASGQPNINAEEYKSLKIPIPPKNIQADIVAKMDKAYQDKQKKEAQAQDLLNGIDNYLLSELGIDLPKKIDNSLKSRMFIKKFSDIEGGRFDSVMALYQTTVNNLKYPLQNLGSILQKNPQYGANEVGVGRKSRDEIRYIRITDIDNDGFLKNRLGKTVNNIENQYLLNLDDLLLARSGSVGRAYLHKDTGCKSIFAGYLIRFILDDKKVIPDYIFSYMQCSLYKNWVNAIQRIVAQPNINAEEYKSLKIPLPPLEKQNQIAEHISKIRNQAKQLQLEAKTGLEQVKQEVETMILGDKKNG